MGQVNDILLDVLSQLTSRDEVIAAARSRREEVRKAAAKIDGHLRTYASGSIAHNTANHDTDADAGLVLDRRTFPSLGPDGDGEPPNYLVDRVRTCIRDELIAVHPELRTRVGKRAIRFTYNEPFDDGIDPPVELIVALTRRSQAGLWIPNCDRETWDPSDPERHTILLATGSESFRQKRARVIRLAKAENKEHSDPAVCSFNIEALALSSVATGTGLAEAIARHWEDAAESLDEQLTPDPAGVSADINTLIPREDAARRQRRAATLLREALDLEGDQEQVRATMSRLFPSYVSEALEGKAALAQALRRGNAAFGLSGVPIVAGTRSLKTTRAYGDLRR